MIRTISSAFTFLMKCVFAPVWIIGFGFGTVSMFLAKNHFHDRAVVSPQPEMELGFLISWVIGVIFLWWFCIRLKRVRIGEEALYISNYLEEIRVPLRDVVDIGENRLINIHPIALKFQSKTKFGSSIVFMPKTRWFSFWSPHPVVSEIQNAVERAKRN